MSDAGGTLSRQPTRVSGMLTDKPRNAARSQWSTLPYRASDGLAVVGFSLAICAYFWFIHQYGANMLWHDQWDDINIISHTYSHTLSLNMLWAQHNENRLFFPNLIVLVLARTSHFNVLFEEYLSGLMLVAATGLFVLGHKRRSPSMPWVYYCPIAIVMLSFVQYPNALWGFQMAWYLVILALSVALFLLDTPNLSWLFLVGAIIAAIVGSFSSLQGLLIWPTGLLLLYCRHRRKGLVFAWITAAAVSGAVYFYHFNFAANVSNDTVSYVFTHPLTAAEFFFTSIGNVVGMQIPYSPSAHSDALLALGVVIVGLAIWVLIAYGIHRDESSAGPFGAALVCFGLLFAAAITEGRTLPGWGPSAGTRYATFNLLILVGCYMCLLGQPIASAKARPWDRISLPVMRAVVVAAICLLFVLGIYNGLTGGRSWHQSQLIAADFTVNIDKIPGETSSGTFIPGFLPDLSFVRQMAHVARTHHLSLFTTDAVAKFEKEGLPFQPVTQIVGPSNGARLKGSESLHATASAPFETIRRVEFRLTGDNLGHYLIGTARSTDSGWLYVWNSATVPDGTYTLQSEAYTATGTSAFSAGVQVTVGN